MKLIKYEFEKYKTICIIICFWVISISVNCQSSYPYRIVKVDCDSRRNQRVITSKEEFKKVCDIFNSPAINFNTEILVNLSYSSGGCSRPNRYIEVTKDDKTKTIKCILFVEDTGNCRINFPISKWIVIRKPIGDYKITSGMIKY